MPVQNPAAQAETHRDAHIDTHRRTETHTQTHTDTHAPPSAAPAMITGCCHDGSSDGPVVGGSVAVRSSVPDDDDVITTHSLENDDEKSASLRVNGEAHGGLLMTLSASSTLVRCCSVALICARTTMPPRATLSRAKTVATCDRATLGTSAARLSDSVTLSAAKKRLRSKSSTERARSSCVTLNEV